MEVGHRMAGLWRLHRHRRADRDCFVKNPDVVHLYLIPDARFADHRLHGARILDEYEAVHPHAPAQSAALAVGIFVNYQFAIVNLRFAAFN